MIKRRVSRRSVLGSGHRAKPRGSLRSLNLGYQRMCVPKKEGLRKLEIPLNPDFHSGSLPRGSSDSHSQVLHFPLMHSFKGHKREETFLVRSEASMECRWHQPSRDRH